ncbi:MAG TPA: DUF3592 domain-containing protein [Candidatus Acidoferrales bacterium]|jgi:hypothetical protein|nr:DUF3592 domain-containing protein [Candidatus Acidoferrales bacterium]
MKRVIIFSLALVALCAWYRVSFFRYYVPVRAVLVHFQPNNHKRFDYLYVVSGATYSGAATIVSSKVDLATFRTGTQLTVYYDTQHPANSTVNPTVLRGNKSIWLLIIPGTLILLGIIFCPRPRNPVRR